MDYLFEVINKYNGSISFAEFMEIALYHPKYGYYMHNIPIYDDFITSPEVSQMFGEIIAFWVFSTWEKLGKAQNIALVELGAGLGTMMADIIRIIKKFPQLYSVIEIYIIEISPCLKKKQQQKLCDQHLKIKWLNSIDELPINKQTIFIANEFFDAFPINQYIFKNGYWYQKRISIDSEKKLISLNSAIANLDFNCSEINYSKFLEKSLIVENSSMTDKMLKLLNKNLKSNSGAILIIDYGYLEKPYTSTIQSMKKNKYIDPLGDVGNSDITAWVDFGKFDEFDICTQKEFLFNFGIRERLSKLLQSNPNLENTLYSQFDRLTSKNHMGEIFKVAIKIIQ